MRIYCIMKRLFRISVICFTVVMLSACGYRENKDSAETQSAGSALIDALLGSVGVTKGESADGEVVYLWKDERIFNETVDAFFKAVDERDEEALLNLFSPCAREETEIDMEEEIERLFAFYPGPTEKCERDGHMASSSGGVDHGSWKMRYSQYFAVISNGITYYCQFNMVTRDDTDETQLGVWSVNLVSEKAICSEDFKFSSKPGLHIVEDAPGNYDTRRMSGYPHIFVPMDRRLTEGEITAFLDNDADFSHFRKHFGEPNAEPYDSQYAYELEDEDGEKRYAFVAVRNMEEDGKAADAYEKGTVWRVTVHGEAHKGWLYVLWGQEE